MNVISENKQHLEQEALRLIREGKHYFDQWRELGLWLACHRLVARGILRESAVSNCFDLVEVVA